MSGKLDQSLDDISKTRRATNRRNRPVAGRRVAAGKTRAAAAPAGGISKKSTAKASGPSKAAAAAAVAAVPASGNSKIIVSGLPSDVTEDQIKEYFAKAVGPVRRASLTYGPNGRSKGIATILFNKPESASAAASSLNGVKVDNRSIRVEVVLGASQVAAPPAPKGLGDRIAKPKAAATKAKAADKAKPKTAGTATGTAGVKGKAGGRRGRAARSKPKSAAELDQEMTDYFVAPTNGAPAAAPTNGTAAAGGDAAMEEEVL